MPTYRSYPEIKPELLKSAKLYCNRYDLIKSLPRGGVWAEIGVAFGNFTSFVLETAHPECVHAFDIFRLHEYEHLWGERTAERFENGTHFDYYVNRFRREIEAKILRVHQGDGATKIVTLPPSSFDVIYIDADHRYEAVVKDLNAAAMAIKPDGTIVMNDYTLYDASGNLEEYGVIQATNEFINKERCEVIAFAFHPGMYCDIAIKMTK